MHRNIYNLFKYLLFCIYSFYFLGTGSVLNAPSILMRRNIYKLFKCLLCDIYSFYLLNSVSDPHVKFIFQNYFQVTTRLPFTILKN